MKNLKQIKKMAAAVILTAAVSAAGVGVVYAANNDPEHAPGCARLGKTIRCTGPMYTHLAGVHQVVVSASNITVTCEVTELYGRHDISCSNSYCRVHLSTETRVCAQYHDCYVCESLTGLCQQQ